MQFRQLTKNNDWTFGGGLSNYASGAQAVELNLLTSIQMWAGDFFASLNPWINWKGLMQIGKQKQLDAALQGLISRSFGVQGINSASVRFNPTTRKFFPTYDVSTIYSTQVVHAVQILSGQAQPGN